MRGKITPDPKSPTLPAAPSPYSSTPSIVAAWNAAYGGATTTGDWTSSPIGMLPASAARRVASSLPASGLPQTVAMVCEVSIPAKAGELPELTFLVPQALQGALKNLSQQERADDYPNAPAGLGMLLGACGAVRMKVLKPVDPPKCDEMEVIGGASMKLENAVSSALGLFRLLEGCQSDSEFAFERNSPVWILLSEVGANLQSAYEGATSRAPSPESKSHFLALEVMEAGGIARPAPNGAAV